MLVGVKNDDGSFDQITGVVSSNLVLASSVNATIWIEITEKEKWVKSMEGRRLSVVSLTSEPDFRDGFRNWIKTRVVVILR